MATVLKFSRRRREGVQACLQDPKPEVVARGARLLSTVPTGVFDGMMTSRWSPQEGHARVAPLSCSILILKDRRPSLAQRSRFGFATAFPRRRMSAG